jgi:3-phosphoshikimate 1-carboxyvinyltransferase
MKMVISPAKPSGAVKAIPSKSAAHRALICAALADGVCMISLAATSTDIEATVRCLRALGAHFAREGSV